MFDWIMHVIDTGGYAGVFFLMVLENLFPPLPSEVIVPLAGYSAAIGEMNIVLVILWGSLGAMVGTLPWYYVAKRYGLTRLKHLSERYGRFMAMSTTDIDMASRWFQRNGYIAVMIGRVVPTIRTLISVPAGLAEMPIMRFLAFSFIGSLVWTAALALLGFWLGNQSYLKVSAWIGPVSNVVIIILLAAYIYRVVTFKKGS